MSTILRFDLILFCVLALGISACSTNGKPVIEKVESKFISREGAKVYFSYPQIQSDVDDSLKNKLNIWMKNIPELREKKVAEGEFSKSEADITYDFSVLLLNDSILSIENRKVYKSANGNNIPMAYRPLVLNHRNANLYITPEKLWPEFKRSELAPYIEKSMKSFQSKPNMRAYADGASYLISYSVKKDSLIVYPGNEGEFYSYNRLSTPISELGINW